MAGIYIHVPFCERACHYCDFHFSTSLKLKQRLIQALQREVELRKHEISDDIHTIYFGGGTPSLLSAQDLGEILLTIKEHFKVDKEAEITLEANPEHLSAQSVKSWKGIGINRLSLGVQSFDDDILRFLNRGHTSAQAKEAIAAAQANGISNITVDLIYGIPGMSHKLWLQQIELLTTFKVPHVSAYHLTIEDQTHFGYLQKTKQLHEISDQHSEQQYRTLVERLLKAGYAHYEVSNFSLPGSESRHNSAYWKGVPYLGLGPSAHSFGSRSRSWNVSSNLKYIKALEAGSLGREGSETIDEDTAWNEKLLVGLRTAWGIDLGALETVFGKPKVEELRTTLETEVSKSHFTISDNVLQLTSDGLFLADNISMKLFA